MCSLHRSIFHYFIDLQLSTGGKSEKRYGVYNVHVDRKNDQKVPIENSRSKSL